MKRQANLDLSEAAKGQVLQCRNVCELGVISDFVLASVHQVEWRALCIVQHTGTQFHPVRNSFHPAGFPSFRIGDADFSDIHCAIHGGLRAIVLPMGVSANYFHGNGFPKNRILD